jgi:hypothetical protein
MAELLDKKADGSDLLQTVTYLLELLGDKADISEFEARITAIERQNKLAADIANGFTTWEEADYTWEEKANYTWESCG